MKKITIKKRSASIIAGLLALALIGGTLAYYNSTGTLENKLSTKAPGGEQLVEQFTPDDDWTPGEKVTKLASIENKGKVPLVVRVKMNEVWTLADGTTKVNNASTSTTFSAGSGQLNATDGLTAGDGSVVIKSGIHADWVLDEDGYWYYNTILAAEATSPNILDGITLNAATDMGLKGTVKYYTKATTRPADDQTSTNVADADTKWVPLTGDMPTGTTFSRSVSSIDATNAGYAGADYSLFITYETYQATAEAIAEAKTAAGGAWDATKTPSAS